jgi:hypothetical protein
VTLHVDVLPPVPEAQGPDQPPNVELPSPGSVSVRVTFWPDMKVALHVEPQLIPDGLLVTVPVPLPVFVTVTVPLALANVPTAFASPDLTIPQLVFADTPEQSPPHDVSPEPALTITGCSLPST